MNAIYCTFFDRKYAEKGVAMLRSLARHSTKTPVVYVAPMDDETRAILEKQKTGFPILRYVQYESMVRWRPRLDALRKERTVQEFFWTLGSQMAQYVMETFEPGSLTYLDADMYFFSDPAVALDDAAKASIAITPHRFPAGREWQEVNGKYCVSWVSWRNDVVGRRCLEEWAYQVLQWCKYANEDGKFADQKYLDAWPKAFQGVHVFEDVAVWPAPWNIWAQEVGPGPAVNGKRVVAYHAHETRRIGKGEYYTTGYPIREQDRKHIYVPYLAELEAIHLEVAGP